MNASVRIVDETISALHAKVELVKAWNIVKQQLIWLECLEAAGVDNWEGYDMAAVMYNKGE